MKKWMCAALIVVGGMFCANIWAAPRVLPDAPAFSAIGQDGKTYSLSDFKDQVVVLEWYNDGCPYVRKHYNSDNMQSLQRTYTAKGVKWFSVISSNPEKKSQGSVKGPKEAAELSASRKAASIILLDPQGKMGRDYGAKTTPHMFIINKGKIVYRGAIDNQDSADKKTLVGAKPYVKLALDEVLAGKSVTEFETEPYGCSVKY